MKEKKSSPSRHRQMHRRRQRKRLMMPTRMPRRSFAEISNSCTITADCAPKPISCSEALLLHPLPKKFSQKFLAGVLFLPLFHYLLIHLGCGHVEPAAFKGIAIQLPGGNELREYVLF